MAKGFTGAGQPPSMRIRLECGDSSRSDPVSSRMTGRSGEPGLRARDREQLDAQNVLSMPSSWYRGQYPVAPVAAGTAAIPSNA
jgi:hypothetical protein